MEALAGAWDVAGARVGASAFARPAFALAHATAFPPVAVHVLYRDGELVAALPLVRRDRLTRVWASATNEHVPIGDFAICGDLREVGVRVLQHLLDGTDVVLLSRLPADGAAASAFRAAAMDLGAAVTTADAGVDTYLRLGPWSEFEARIPRKLRKSVRVHLARLERTGVVRFRRIAGGPELGPALEECFAVEAAGWKGAAGSPITRHPATHRFYSELAIRASAFGQLALYVLEVNGTIIAFKLCVRASGRCDSLKTSYRPEWAAYGPGVLTKFLMARSEIAGGETDVLHFGAPSAEKLRWSSGVVPLITLRIHAATRRARVANAAPAVVDALARSRLTGAAVARGRAARARLRAALHRLRVRFGKRRRHGGPRRATRSAIQSTTTSTTRAAVSSGAPVASTMRPIPERPFTSRR
jgi:CelD/BcsL family acetyltransferase involved in cellulose biosynthesis